MSGLSVLLVEDDPDVALGLRRVLERSGFDVAVADHLGAAVAELRARTFSIALVDLTLPDGDGFSVFDALATHAPETRAICLSGRSDAATAVRAVRAGAVDYLTKPVPRSDLLEAMRSALAPNVVRPLTLRPAPTLPLALPPAPPESASNLLGDSAAWREVKRLALAVARRPRTTVLIGGESGSGKEGIARLIHAASPRGGGPFVAANAACLGETLAESELFGHEAGAFTGAQKRRRGLFELAEGGTLFLDEVGELSLEVQAKLLRVLEGQGFRRVGGEQELTPDVRLVCASHRDLEERVRAGRFRADLHARLQVFELQLPALRARRDDIPLLAEAFVRRLAEEWNEPAPALSPAFMARLMAHDWPGNVRGLKNAIEHAMVVRESGPLEPGHLPPPLQQAATPTPSSPDVAPTAVRPAPTSTPMEPFAPGPALVSTPLGSVIRQHVLATWTACDGNLTHAAERLAISRLALRRRLREYGVLPVGIEPEPEQNEPEAGAEATGSTPADLLPRR